MQTQDRISTTGHAVAFYLSNPGQVYSYDSADDGPEVDVITRIRARNALYIPGKEGELLKFQRFVDDAARALFKQAIRTTGKETPGDC